MIHAGEKTPALKIWLKDSRSKIQLGTFLITQDPPMIHPLQDKNTGGSEVQSGCLLGHPLQNQPGKQADTCNTSQYSANITTIAAGANICRFSRKAVGGFILIVTVSG